MVAKKIETSAERPHAKLGASTCERWWNCPGSIERIANSPIPKPTIYASEGTAAHEVAAASVLSDLLEKQIDKKYRIGSVLVVDGFKITIDEEMWNAVDVYRDYILSIVKKYKLLPGQVLLEQRIRIPSIDGEDQELFGTADCIIPIPFQKLVVIDYKHGRGYRVEIEGNYQLKYYALGAWLAIPAWMRQNIDVVEMTVVQPRCAGAGISSFTIPVEELETFHKDLIEAAGKVKPGAEVKAGSWCKFCPAKAQCPAMIALVQEEAQLDFADVKSLPSVVGESAFRAVSTLTPEMAAVILDNKDLVKNWFDSVEFLVQHMLESDIAVPGYKLVKKNTHRKWLDDDKVAELLEPTFGAAIYAKPKLLSPNQIEKLVKKTIDLSDMYEKPDKGRTLAKDTDARDSIRAIEDDFAGVVIDVEAIVVS